MTRGPGTHPTRILRDKSGQNERHLQCGGDVSVNVMVVDEGSPSAQLKFLGSAGMRCFSLRPARPITDSA